METSVENNLRDFWDEAWIFLANASVCQCVAYDCVAIKPKDDELSLLY